MARPPRVDFKGARHHVMNRGASRRPIFFNDNTRALFVDLLGELPERYGIAIHGFVLMSNHFHLMVESNGRGLSRALGYLQSQYSRRVNLPRGADGSLYRGRFQNRLAHLDDHWTYLLAYLHLNPVRAGMVAHVDRYDWSSHSFYDGSLPEPEWLTTAGLLEKLGGASGYRRFIEDVVQGRRPEPESLAQVLFDEPFHFPAPPREPEPAGAAIARAIEQVALVSGATLKQMRTPRRGRKGNPARAVALYWLVRRAGLSVSRAARYLRMSESSASQTLARLRKAELRGTEMSRMIDNLMEL
jgi:REP element-mobilizing transposase RayT